MKKLLRGSTVLAAIAVVSIYAQQSSHTVLSANEAAEVPSKVPETVIEVAVAAEAPSEVSPKGIPEETKPKAAPAATKPAPFRAPTATGPVSKYGRLVIPAIGLNKPIGAVGLTATGNMGVLDDPSRVGWYRGGAAPGEVGSAVIGAHVYQAFANLKNVKAGDEIYVEGADGKKLRFIVRETAVYAYTDPTPLPKIFDRADTARLNLITCYGQITAGGTTYTHRFVAYATLAA